MVLVLEGIVAHALADGDPKLLATGSHVIAVARPLLRLRAESARLSKFCPLCPWFLVAPRGLSVMDKALPKTTMRRKAVIREGSDKRDRGKVSRFVS